MHVPDFDSPIASKNREAFAILGASRIAGLDRFSEEIKRFERLYKAVCMPSVGITFPYTEEYGHCGLAWLIEDERIVVIDENLDVQDYQPGKYKALSSHPAALRHKARDDDWLGQLFVTVAGTLCNINLANGDNVREDFAKIKISS